MAFPSCNILTARQLAQTMREANEVGTRFCFILGAGASVESGIPSGNNLEMRWMDCLMGKEGDLGASPRDPEDTRRVAKGLREQGLLDHEFGEIETAWQKAKKSNTSIPSAYYFDLYRLRFHASPPNGYRYLEQIMEGRDPSLGYHTLAKLLTEQNRNNLVITTNFDSLVEDALFLYTDKKPLVVGHESLVDYIDAGIQRPIVAKVHRSLMYDPLNSPEATHDLKKGWRAVLRNLLSIYTPVVVGYAGGDQSLMSFLAEPDTILRKGVYWCYLGEPDVSALPEQKIQDFVEQKNGYFVSIQGFDALMLEIGKELYGDGIGPGKTKKYLNAQLDRRMERYTEQWDVLSRKPETQKILQPLNAKEQQAEDRRAENDTLTAWDHLRRGKRLYEAKRWADALQEYERAAALDPKNATAFNAQGAAYTQLGKYSESIKSYSRAIELDPNYAVAYANRAIAHNHRKGYQQAIEDCSKAIELDPNYGAAYSIRGNAYKKLGLTEWAIEDYSKAIDLTPGYILAYTNRGNMYYNMEQYDKAIEDYSKAIELNPNNADTYNNRGVIYGDMGQYDKAIEDYNRAIELNPKLKTAYYNRAKAYRALGQDGPAEADEKTAETL